MSASSFMRKVTPDITELTTVRVWVRCLMQEMEYKTVCITYTTTCRELVHSIPKFKMKHRDPNLFYLTMEVTVRKTGGIMRTTLTLEDDSRPAELQSCHPRGDSRLALKMRPGGLVRVYDGALVPGSQYKSLLVSERTTCEELIRLVLLCNNIHNNVNNFSIYEVRRNDGRERKLHQDERPLRLTSRASLRRCSTKKINTNVHKTQNLPVSPAKPCSTSSTSPVEAPSDNMVPSTTITISPNGASTVTINTPTINTNLNNNNYCKSTNNIEETEKIEEPCPVPPLRSPRPVPPSRAAVRRQLPWTQSVDLVETPVDDDNDDELHANVRTRRAHSYNDYENYFYI
ncbi:putative Ras association (RalGDS/AF-6) domain-containing protein 2 [Homarus americanus]|uniref:Putative Ras association (RalGDS/AF-6) domain-containing protein 2 n=1 Tax=Homarus americanus TaxID=6706 RepID=A0A8J5JDB0_HOMAM|nr:putative Ras association (RalGDS/AF-6) domain-containing protein 2 [Homarus americanus]